MSWIFWISISLIFYTYLGYPAWLWVHSRYRSQSIQQGPFSPRISIVMVVRNEESVLARKLDNLKELNYVSALKEIVVVSDGSTDGTNSILNKFAQTSGMRIIVKQTSQGKAAALNDAIRIACGEVIVFADARQKIEADVLTLLMENFADPSVGGVSGELMLGEPGSGEAGKGTGLYWKIEKEIRKMESRSWSVVGATGALYALRKKLLVKLPLGTILDDVYLPMHVVKQGFRVLFDSRARAWDTPDLGGKREFARKVRTLAGNYQLLHLSPWLLSWKNPICFEFVSHKVMRLLVPFAMLAALLSTAGWQSLFYRAAFALQLLFYILAAVARVLPKRIALTRVAEAARTLVVLNTAALVAFTIFVTGHQAAWER